eukprot:6453496-Prymnesium_polylepis.2
MAGEVFGPLLPVCRFSDVQKVTTRRESTAPESRPRARPPPIAACSPHIESSAHTGRGAPRQRTA